MQKFFDKFRRPTIKAQFIHKGADVRVTIINVRETEKRVTLLFMIVKQIAKAMGIDHRALLNRLVDLDKRINKYDKDEVRQAKYQHRGTRFQ